MEEKGSSGRKLKKNTKNNRSQSRNKGGEENWRDYRKRKRRDAAGEIGK